MPQASQELTDRMIERFGEDRYLEEGPIQFLKDAGYTLSRSWEWKKEGINSLNDMTRDEFECLMFLVHEWDYGGLANG